MARTLDPAAHEHRREAFVDAAYRLMMARGYDRMSIQDVLDDLGASRGAFYHYFDSKATLRDAVMDRMVEQVMSTVEPVLHDPGLSAMAKLEGLFGGIARWKSERTEMIAGLLRVWMADDNAIVRERVRQRTIGRLTPLLTTIIQQGQAEGVFTTKHPPPVARVIASLLLAANETALELYFARQSDTVSFADVELQMAAYGEAFERVLGLPPGSWPANDRTLLRQWFG